ncbi:AarF domain-containing protein kinase 1 [Lamellibrachia satsuma]|nr:AarF domain-containing protein kinase 1 [Lamellibrachia satsuma]
MALWKVGKFLTYCTLGGSAVSSVTALHHNDWDVSSIGAVRLGRALATAVVIVADYKYSLYGTTHGSRGYSELKSKVHLRSAQRLCDLCCLNGGCFIKVGQHIGSLEYLLPYEYVSTMRVLHSDAPKSPVEDIYKVIREELGKDVDELFVEFDPEPIGAASLAQVHRATFKDGTVVAVKVQHPRVKAHTYVDMKTMELMVHIAELLFPDFRFRWLAEESKKNLPIELDFYNEAKNCERVADMFKHFQFLKVPSVHWDMTTDRMMTMEYCPGGQVNDRDYILNNDISVNEVIKNLTQLYSEMIFVHGYIHCDPHPGNVLVNKTETGTQIVLLDHGLYQTLTDDFRMNYCHLWLSLLKADVDAIRMYADKMGTGDLYHLFACMVTSRSWKAVEKGIDKTSITEEEETAIQEEASNYIPEITDILNRVPRQMLLIFKTNDLLRGIETMLNTRAHAHSFITMSQCCVRAVYEEERAKCKSLVCKLRLDVIAHWTLFQVKLYEWYLWVRSYTIVQKVAACKADPAAY